MDYTNILNKFLNRTFVIYFIVIFIFLYILSLFLKFFLQIPILLLIAFGAVYYFTRNRNKSELASNSYSTNDNEIDSEFDS